MSIVCEKGWTNVIVILSLKRTAGPDLKRSKVVLFVKCAIRTTSWAFVLLIYFMLPLSFKNKNKNSGITSKIGYLLVKLPLIYILICGIPIRILAKIPQPSA